MSVQLTNRTVCKLFLKCTHMSLGRRSLKLVSAAGILVASVNATEIV